MREILSDLLRYAWTVLLLWLAFFGGAFITAVCFFYEKWQKGEIYLSAYLWIAAGCFVAASFIAWQKEHDKVRGKGRRQILTSVMDLIQSRYETIRALVHLNEDFGTERDVIWVCKKLNSTELQSDPFEFYELKYGRGAFRGKRLKFLRDARISGRPINNDEDALNYIYSVWGDKHGLTEETTGEPRARFAIIQAFNKWSNKSRR